MMEFLSSSSDAGIIKVVFGLIAVIIWAVSATVSAAKKRNEDNKRRQQYGVLPPDLNPAGYALPVPPMPQRANPAQKRQRGPAQRGAAQPARRAAAEQAPPVPRWASPVPAQAAATAVVPSPSTSTQPSRIARLARRPETLRAAFILSEVLAPPKSLRDDSGHGV